MSAPSSNASSKAQPTISRLSDFDSRSGSILERALFNHRRIVLFLCLAMTLLLGWQASHLRLNASFEKMIPTTHPFIVNYLKYRSELTGLGNSVRIAVATDGDSIYSEPYLALLQKISDEAFLLPGVDRAYMKSLWTPSTRWAAVTEEGLDGGPVIPDDYDGSPQSIAQLRANLERSTEIGQLVARNLKSSVIVLPLLSIDPRTGQALDYAEFGRALEALRSSYQGPLSSPDGGTQNISIQITGFAKVIGDLIDGLRSIALFFAVAIALTTAVLYFYTRCVRSTLLVVSCSLVAVLWQLGALPLLGYELDPYSILVPFLVFAIGMSHGAQKMNGIMQDVGRGTHRLVAARYTFRRLFMAGLAALLCDAVGFAVLMLIRIKVIQDLAIIASLGVAILIFTNLILLPVLLSYVGVSASAARRSLRDEASEASGARQPWLWRTLDRFTQRRWASIAVIAAVLLGAVGYFVSLNLKIGDLQPGAPELRAHSRYNLDAAIMTATYGASSDVFAVMVKTPDNACSRYDTLMRLDALDWQMSQVPGVESTDSLALLARRMSVGLNEGSPRWYELLNNQNMLNTITAAAPRGLYNESCSLLTEYVYLGDHRAETLERVVGQAEAFAAANHTDQAEFLLAAGSAGIEAATNIVVKQASREMLLWVYAAVVVLCLITFRSWRAVLCAVLPLVLTSILSEALMVELGMGVKVATLPVTALGVGIGVDYALYVMSIVLARMKEGDSLSVAYHQALLFTGKVVMLTGVTLAVGVATWAASPIKFQADMGVLLAFMFLWNMLGALILLPALAHFLLKPATTQDAHAPKPVTQSSGRFKAIER